MVCVRDSKQRELDFPWGQHLKKAGQALHGGILKI